MSLQQCKDTPCSGATQGTMPSPIFTNLSKNTDNCVETDRPNQMFFDGNLIS
jgi:hypothetical protein